MTDLCIFAEETSLSGARCFILCDKQKMWHKIEKNNANNRCFYEVITEHFFARFYLDIELKTSNHVPGISDGSLQNIINAVDRHFGYSPLIVLDSSTCVKQSYHLIWPDIVRNSNSEYRDFVYHLSRLESCNAIPDTNSTIRIIDTAPYCLRQNFRMYKCCKKGRTSAFEQHHLTSECFRALDSYDFFLKTLICLNRKPLSPCAGRPTQYDKSVRVDYAEESALNTNNLRMIELVVHSLLPELNNFKLSRCKYFVDTGILLLLSNQPFYCAMVGRKHQKNTGYFVFNEKRCTFEHRCSDGTCKTLSNTRGWKKYSLSGAYIRFLLGVVASYRKVVSFIIIYSRHISSSNQL